MFSDSISLKTRFGKHSPNGSSTQCDNIIVKHHISQLTISSFRVLSIKLFDFFNFPVPQPMISLNQSIMFIDFSISVEPGVIFTWVQIDPFQYACFRNPGFTCPLFDKVNQSITNFMGNPAAFQSSPSSFFNWICSSSNSDNTSFFFVNFDSSCSICFCSDVLQDAFFWVCLKALAPFSKNCFCQL